MNEERDHLPLARMATINRPSFWIYFLVCAILFTCSMFRSDPPMANWQVSSLIATCVFTALLLELIGQRLKSEKTTGLLINICYLFEAASILTFIFIIFWK